MFTSRFRVLERLGAGGMGEVFRATDETTGETVAVKRMRLSSTSSGERFVREGSILALLKHPNIVRYVGHGIDEEGYAFIAMEWLRGEDLQSRLHRERLLPRDALAIASRIADGLAAAHALGVVHRDVKPSNVFLVNGDEHDVRLLDFGIAKPLVASQRMTATGAFIGTLGYIAPEQALCEDVDPRSDVFSLGCVLFECLTGKPAFSAAHPAAVLAKLVMEPPPIPSGVAVELAVFDALLASLLARDRHARPADGAAAGSAIRHVMDCSTVVETSLPPSTITTRERESMTVLLARLRDRDSAQQSEAAFRALADDARGRFLDADGTFLCVWDADVTRDQVLRAARLAVLAHDEMGATSVIATGYGERAGDRALGDVVERAARLLELAGAGDFLVDDASAEILERRFEITRVDGRARLGREIDMSEERRERAPLIGRDRELRLLLEMYRECRDEPTSRGLLVSADAGMGKSRLLREVLRACDGARVWKARGDSMRGGPYDLLAQLVRRALELPGNSDAKEARRRLEKRALGKDAASLVVDFLLEVMSLVDDDIGEALRAARSDPSLMAVRVRDAMAAFCRTVCAEQALVIALEDLHWADAPTLRVLEHVVDRSSDLPLFVVAAARPEFRTKSPELWVSEHFQEIRLGGLTRKSAEKLARALSGGASPERVMRAVERAAGSPLWLEELFREGDDDAEVPDTLLAIIQAHLAREPQLERRVLRAAAVFGERFPVRGVMHLVGVANEEIDEALRTLVAKEWLVRVSETRREGQVDMAFRHALLRDAVYGMLTDDDRMTGHGLAARWLMSAGETDPMAIASHLERSDAPTDAIPFYARAGRAAIAANDLASALAAATRGRELGAQGAARIGLRLVEAEAATWLGQTERASAAIDGILDEVEPSNTLVLGALGWASMLGTMRGVDELPLRAFELFRKVDPASFADDEYCRTAAYVHSGLLFAGERERADELVALLEQRAIVEGHNRARGWRAHVRLMHARFTLGDTWSERLAGIDALHAFRAAFDSPGEVQMYGVVGITEMTLGAFARGRAFANEAETLSRRYNQQMLLALPLAVSACCAAAEGDARAARAYCERATAQALRIENNEIYSAYSLVLVAYALRLIGEFAGALKVTREVRSSAKLLAVRAAADMQHAAALVGLGEDDEALATCLDVISVTQPRHMRGALDLDFYGTLLRVFDRTNQREMHDATLTRATKIVARRASNIDEPFAREEFLRFAGSLGITR